MAGRDQLSGWLRPARICPPDTELSVGDRVMHKVFGEGTITAMRTDIGCYVIKFDKMATERNLKIGTGLEKIGNL